jgi:hypothetical protein
MSDSLKYDNECCADARGPFFTSEYRCGRCPACAAEGITEQRLDMSLPCGFFCSCIQPEHDEAEDRQAVAADLLSVLLYRV